MPSDFDLGFATQINPALSQAFGQVDEVVEGLRTPIDYRLMDLSQVAHEAIKTLDKTTGKALQAPITQADRAIRTLNKATTDALKIQDAKVQATSPIFNPPQTTCYNLYNCYYPSDQQVLTFSSADGDPKGVSVQCSKITGPFSSPAEVIHDIETNKPGMFMPNYPKPLSTYGTPFCVTTAQILIIQWTPKPPGPYVPPLPPSSPPMQPPPVLPPLLPPIMPPLPPTLPPVLPPVQPPPTYNPPPTFPPLPPSSPPMLPPPVLPPPVSPPVQPPPPPPVQPPVQPCPPAKQVFQWFIQQWQTFTTTTNIVNQQVYQEFINFITTTWDNDTTIQQWNNSTTNQTWHTTTNTTNIMNPASPPATCPKCKMCDCNCPISRQDLLDGIKMLTSTLTNIFTPCLKVCADDDTTAPPPKEPTFQWDEWPHDDIPPDEKGLYVWDMEDNRYELE